MHTNATEKKKIAERSSTASGGGGGRAYTTGAVQQQLGRRARKVLDPISPPPSHERTYLSRRVAVVVVADLRVQGHRQHIVRANSTHTNTQYCVFFISSHRKSFLFLLPPRPIVVLLRSYSAAVRRVGCSFRCYVVVVGRVPTVCEAEAYRYIRAFLFQPSPRPLCSNGPMTSYIIRAHTI